MRLKASVRTLAAAALVALAAGCVSVNYPQAPTPGAPPPSAPSETSPNLPTGQIDLGDYRRNDEQGVLNRFSREVSRRYAAGLALSAATQDLRANQFACAAPADRRGEAPAQECRREIREAGCTHSWEVHLFGGAGAAVSRTGAFYDRLCNTNSGLLGAPPR